MENISHKTKPDPLSSPLPTILKISSGLLLLVSIQSVSAKELIASHGDWEVSYGEERKSVVTITLNPDRMVFGFVCTISNQPDCTIGAHLPVRCGDNTEVSAKILIDSKPVTDWGANCESADNPESGESDRVLLTSKLSGKSVDALLAAMRTGRTAAVTVETKSNKILQSVFSLSGYAKAASEMYKVLGWDSTNSNGIGGNDGGTSTAKRDLEKKKWTF